MSNGTPSATLYGIPLEVLKKGVIVFCLVGLAFWFQKYTLEPNATTQKVLINSAIESTTANTESVRIMAESTVNIAKSNRDMIELSKTMNQKLDLIIASRNGGE